MTAQASPRSRADVNRANNQHSTEFDHLRSTLRNEHQPANTTEEILVDGFRRASFHKTLTALAKLQNARGFVPQKTAAELKAFEYTGCFPEDMDEYVVNSHMNLSHSTEKIA